MLVLIVKPLNVVIFAGVILVLFNVIRADVGSSHISCNTCYHRNISIMVTWAAIV